jgi:hypothetical protein
VTAGRRHDIASEAVGLGERVLVAHTGAGRIVLVGVESGLIRRWDGRTGDPIGEAWTDPGGPATVAHLPDGRALLVLGGNGVRRLEIESGEELPSLSLHPDEQVLSVAMFARPDGQVLLFAGGARRIRCWDIGTGVPVGVPVERGAEALAPVRRPGGGIILWAATGLELCAFDPFTGAVIRPPVAAFTDGVGELRLVDSADGRELLVGVDLAGCIHRWDPFTGAVEISVGNWDVPVELISVYHDPDGRPVGCVEYYDESEHPIQRLYLDTGARLHDLPTNTRAVYRDGDRYIRVSYGPHQTIVLKPLPETSVRDSGAERQVCPRCLLPATPIMYGFPTREGAELIHVGRVVSGGCVINSDSPTFACPRFHRWRPAPGAPRPTADTPLSVAARLYRDGDLAGAERVYREAARSTGARLGPGHADTLALHRAVVTVLYQAGRMVEGEAEYRAMWTAAGRPLNARAVPTLDEVRAAVERRRQVVDEPGPDDPAMAAAFDRYTERLVSDEEWGSALIAAGSAVRLYERLARHDERFAAALAKARARADRLTDRLAVRGAPTRPEPSPQAEAALLLAAQLDRLAAIPPYKLDRADDSVREAVERAQWLRASSPRSAAEKLARHAVLLRRFDRHAEAHDAALAAVQLYATVDGTRRDASDDGYYAYSMMLVATGRHDRGEFNATREMAEAAVDLFRTHRRLLTPPNLVDLARVLMVLAERGQPRGGRDAADKPVVDPKGVAKALHEPSRAVAKALRTPAMGEPGSIPRVPWGLPVIPSTAERRAILG